MYYRKSSNQRLPSRVSLKVPFPRARFIKHPFHLPKILNKRPLPLSRSKAKLTGLAEIIKHVIAAYDFYLNSVLV